MKKQNNSEPSKIRAKATENTLPEYISYIVETITNLSID